MNDIEAGCLVGAALASRMQRGMPKLKGTVSHVVLESDSPLSERGGQDWGGMLFRRYCASHTSSIVPKISRPSANTIRGS